MPKRHVFISYQHRDQMKAKGFNLMRYNKHLNLDFVGRHLLDPVDSITGAYISSKIKEQLNGSSATVVLIGKETADSDWVDKEIQWSIEKGNGLIGIRLDPDTDIPPGLEEAGAEILDWDEVTTEFPDALERAIEATRRGKNMPLNSSSTCARAS
jgi:hypothetical protein